MRIFCFQPRCSINQFYQKGGLYQQGAELFLASKAHTEAVKSDYHKPATQVSTNCAQSQHILNYSHKPVTVWTHCLLTHHILN